MPPRLNVNPNLLEPPDFTSDTFATARDAIAAAPNVTPEQAIAILEAGWNADIEKRKEQWVQQQQEDQDADEATRLAREEEIEREREEDERQKQQEQREKDKKRPKLNPLRSNKLVASTIKTRPSHFAMHKLQERDYIELSYFTAEGREEASRSDHTVAEEAFAFSKINEVVALRPIAAYKAASKVIPDDQLTWTQMTRAKTNLLDCMDETGWPSDYTEALATFFMNLENHKRLQDEGGEAIILAYQAQVWRDWHRALKDPSGADAFDISAINETLMDSFATKLTEMRNRVLTTR